ncbi:MAG: hypothetical protein JWM98_480, partial [Thermoleophilia bacterium]|nr:hypothetical protein [Thermoleophilia bacterium]
NHRLQEAVRAGTMSLDEAVAASRDTVVIGEAATSAGTKGTELVLGHGVNPVTESMVGQMLLQREGAAERATGLVDTVDGANALHGRAAAPRAVRGVAAERF